jgi:hypothetical protein
MLAVGQPRWMRMAQESAIPMNAATRLKVVYWIPIIL